MSSLRGDFDEPEEIATPPTSVPSTRPVFKIIVKKRNLKDLMNFPLADPISQPKINSRHHDNKHVIDLYAERRYDYDQICLPATTPVSRMFLVNSETMYDEEVSQINLPILLPISRMLYQKRTSSHYAFKDTTSSESLIDPNRLLYKG